MKLAQIVVVILLCFDFVLTERSAKWDFCNCRFLNWQSWSQCTKSCGGGTRERSRLVRHTVKEGCTEFTDCATNSMGSDYGKCNQICYNGGTFNMYWCRCTDGWKGRCCNDRVTCGNPGSVKNGQSAGTDFTYGKSVTYSCNRLYNMTSGERVRTCNKYGVWTGTLPRCVYVNTCLSNPCQNGGTCVDGLDRYDCRCQTGWSGIHCETDVQPPQMRDCPSDMKLFSSTPNKNVKWSTPTFLDPVGTEIKVTQNYPTNNWDFPWGDFTVQYNALKPSNGLRTDCIFNITVRPHPCPHLNIPDNGAKVCNGWKTGYGQYCMVFCDANHDVFPGIDLSQWYICGASGAWKPSDRLPNCTASYSASLSAGTEDTNFHFSQCNNPKDDLKLQQTYIVRMKNSTYSYFCDRFNTGCFPDNVEVLC